jgi:predicted metal-dependent hydrolase
MSYDMGFRFAMEKQQWIRDHVTLLQEKKGKKKPIGEQDAIDTRFHTIQIKRHQGQSVTSKKLDATITLFFPEAVDLSLEKNQETIKAFTTEVLRKEAKNYLPNRIQELASTFGFTFSKVFVKNLKSRWGSCSAQNNINLNLHLMRLPEHLSDYIILHELCHTIHKNHGPAFHALLEKLCGNEKLLNKELKKYRTQF